jgi:hypothetical protein
MKLSLKTPNATKTISIIMKKRLFGSPWKGLKGADFETCLGYFEA